MQTNATTEKTVRTIKNAIEKQRAKKAVKSWQRKDVKRAYDFNLGVTQINHSSY